MYENYQVVFLTEEAVKEAADVAGRDVTPFILRRVSEITAGHSLQSSILYLKSVANFEIYLTNFLNFLIILYISGSIIRVVFLTNTDIALIKNNAKIGAQIAVEYSKLSTLTVRYCVGPQPS